MPAKTDSKDSKELALSYIKDRIVTCEMAPGSAININEVAEKLGISKTPVREALLALAYDGYVTVNPRKSTTVSKISLQDLKDIYDARSLVETHILRTLGDEIASNLDTLYILKSRWESMDLTDRSRETYLGFLQQDLAFHQTIIRLYPNRHLVKYCQELIYQSQRFWYMALFNNNMEAVREEHLKILDALINGSPQTAAQTLQKHINVSKALSILSE